MGKWYVQSWDDEMLEVDADDLEVMENGTLILRTDDQPVLVLADGTYRSAFAQDAGEIARKVAPQRIFDMTRNGLAVVIDINAKEQG